jgi:ABC-type transporter Mla maintaining outer membrane lipid asymmetry ATPase subunit MlaF
VTSAPPPFSAPPPSGFTLTLPVAGEPGITLDRVSFTYDDKPVLRDLSWELERGQSAVVTGANGCGKSTLLYVAAGLVAPDSGTVLLASHPVRSMLPSTRVRKGLRLGFVFQEGGMLANLDVIANVALALRYHADVFELDEEGIRQRTEEALEIAQIARADWNELPAHLSFGTRKRLALARAIAMRPNFFFFDDPNVGMDQRTAQITHQILCMFRDDPDVTLLVATNHPILIERLEVPGYRLEGGQLVTRTSLSSLPPTMPKGLLRL